MHLTIFKKKLIKHRIILNKYDACLFKYKKNKTNNNLFQQNACFTIVIAEENALSQLIISHCLVSYITVETVKSTANTLFSYKNKNQNKN